MAMMKERVAGIPPQRPQEKVGLTEEDILLVVVHGAVSGTEMACLRMSFMSDGVRVKTALTVHLKSTEFVQALITEDGQVMEDSMTLAELGVSSTVRLSAVLGKFQWVGVWAPVKVSDMRVGDYMSESGNMCIEADGSVTLLCCGNPEFLFKGDPPHANENFKVFASGKKGALEKMAMVRQSDDSIRVTHGGDSFSWLRRESAFIEYKLVELGADEGKAPEEANKQAQSHNPDRSSVIL